MSSSLLTSEFIESEKTRVISQLELYEKSYNNEDIKCFNLKRLINIKKRELEILNFLSEQDNS